MGQSVILAQYVLMNPPELPHYSYFWLFKTTNSTQSHTIPLKTHKWVILPLHLNYLLGHFVLPRTLNGHYTIFHIKNIFQVIFFSIMNLNT